MGDFNLAFSPLETKNRMYTAQEQRVASVVKDLISGLNMGDIWEANPSFTWRRANSDSLSTIDRIAFNKANLKICKRSTNWSLSFSDHAAIEASFIFVANKSSPRSRITRLDPSLARDPNTKTAIVSGYEEMLSTMPDSWDPHMKLDFAKMCIRTVVERVQAERKTREASEEERLNEELYLAIAQLAEGTAGVTGDLIDYIEELRSKKARLIEEKGSRLAEKLKTKWFNEGEKSNRYFLRLLNRAMPDDFKKLEGQDGRVIDDPNEVEKEIVNFYKTFMRARGNNS